MRVQPSNLFGRATYKTPQAGGNQTSPLNLPQVAQTVPYFELIARVASNSGLLAYIEAAFHQLTPIGTYLLLLDQTSSSDQQGQGVALVADGDPALVTLGPTQALGSIIVFSHADCEAPLWLEVQGSDAPNSMVKREMRGFPFDAGCIAVLSSTPGVLTQLQPIQEFPAPGARFTARWQSCG
jgi:hypothetical protein